MKFNIGDWLFFDHKLAYVKEIRGDYVSISTVGIEVSGDLWDRCFPLTVWNKAMSDNAEYWMDKFHREGGNGLNFPDISRKVSALWADACEHPDDKERAEKIGAWCSALYRKIQDARMESIDGVYIFGKRDQ